MTRARPEILSAIPGRIRVHIPAWSGHGQLHLERRVRQVPGVRRAVANAVTGNILICFDPNQTDKEDLLHILSHAEDDTAELPEDKPLPPVLDEAKHGSIHQARITVRGIDRDPNLAGQIIERLQESFGVRVRSMPITGRIVVEYDATEVDLHDLLARVAEVELPDLPGEDRPDHPLDKGPLVHSATRTIGATLGLSLIVFRRLAGRTLSTRAVKAAATVAGIVSLLRSFSSIRNGARRLFGPNASDLLFSSASVMAHAMSGSPLGLTLTGLEGLILLNEVMARRSSWRRYEERLQGSSNAEPGAVIRMEAGERVPLSADVVEGTGTAIGLDGLPRRISPGSLVSAGSDLSGGPFVLHLHGGKPFVPQPRPAPLTPDLYTYYLRTIGVASLAYASLTALLTRSISPTFKALLLVNPRTAIVGMEAANLDAASRAMRAGVIVIGSRHDRVIRRPDVLLLDGPRVLTDGMEITTVLPQEEEIDVPQLLALAGEICTAAGAPWGDVFPKNGVHPKAVEAHFNGLWTTATLNGVRYTLGPPEDPPSIEEAVERRHRGGYLLLLCRERDRHELGLVALRPRKQAAPDGSKHVARDYEITAVLPLDETQDAPHVLALATSVSAAAGSPWGAAFPVNGKAPPSEGSFNGLWATGTVNGELYSLGPPHDPPAIGKAVARRHHGGYLLALSREEDHRPLGFVCLRPSLSATALRLVETCKRLNVQIDMRTAGSPQAARALAMRAGVALLPDSDAVTVIRQHQQHGKFVAFVSDNAQAGPAFADCDLAIGLAPMSTGQFPARADLLAPDLDGVSAILEAGKRRDAAVRDAVLYSAASNVFGAVWGLREAPGVERVSTGVYVTALAALADGWLRLRGGKRTDLAASQVIDPHPERWGRRSLESVFHSLQSSEKGLDSATAKQRQRSLPQTSDRMEIVTAILDQVRSPVNAILSSGALLSLIAGGAALDIVIIGATVAVNVAVGVWQEQQANEAVGALRKLATASARVLRDGVSVTLPVTQVVPGDILLLAPGDRVAADARLIEAQYLELDEAALTGESAPVRKRMDAPLSEGRVVLEGSGVTVGTGRAVVVAVGRRTRLGATAAALSMDDLEDSPFGARLARLVQLSLPISVAGGLTVVASGLLWGKPLISQISVGASIALAVVPESLPLLAGTGQVGAARRLARRKALLRRLAAVEALGRVDVACTDKTGTLTEGRLAVRLVAGCSQGEVNPTQNGHNRTADTYTFEIGQNNKALPDELRLVLLTAALASPHPDATDAVAHPTDVAVLAAAKAAGLEDELRSDHRREAPFEPDRAYHAAVVGDRLCVKGAPEVVAARCSRWRRQGKDDPLDEAGRQALEKQVSLYSERGLRILMVADGLASASVEDPKELRALGFLGISDPIRSTVPDAIRRCHEAGVRVLMITGDHPATAQVTAREAGLLNGERDVLTGPELADLGDVELQNRLRHAKVIARATPLDKLRIIEGLRRLGHTVAMTGDGVNDAPALRLADVGVAMGRSGTEVARQAADIVLADDDFSTLVEALVEGRGFWRNMRSSLGLLLGGNLGELGLIVGTTILGMDSPLNTRQILAVNLITDALPALSIVLQPPEHRNLSRLAREGTTALDASLRWDVLRRGSATTLPALAAYLLARGSSTPPQASAVAFGTIVSTQLAQTLDTGWSEGILNRPVLGAVGGSAAFLLSTLTWTRLRNLLGLSMPTPFGWALIATGSLASVAISRAWGVATLANEPSQDSEPEPEKDLPRKQLVPVQSIGSGAGIAGMVSNG